MLDRRGLGKTAIFGFGAVALSPLFSSPAFATPAQLSEVILRQQPAPLAPEKTELGAIGVPNDPMSVVKLLLVCACIQKMMADGIDPHGPFIYSAEATTNISEFHLNFKNGDTVENIDALAFAVLNSCNESALQLALRFFGSKEAAVKAMQDLADSFGMKDTRIVSPNGLPVGNDRGAMTAYDAALMGMKVHELLNGTPIYDRIMNVGGFVTSETAYKVFKDNNRAFPRASNQGENGFLHLFPSGNGLIPEDLPGRDQVRVLKTGSRDGLSNAVICDERSGVAVSLSVMGANNKTHLGQCIGRLLQATTPLAMRPSAPGAPVPV